jgi:hypothetical protein
MNFQGLFFMTPRPSNPFTTALVLASALLAPAAWAQSTDLSACMAELRPAARTGKVSDATWARHTAGLQADFSVIEKLNFQPEFRTAIWDYMSALVDEERVTDGTARLAQHRPALERAEDRFGVDPERASHPDGGQFTVVHQAVDRHLADPHQRGHLGDGEKLRSGDRLAVRRTGVAHRFRGGGVSRRWPIHRRHRYPFRQAQAVQRLPHRWHPPGAYRRTIAWPMGFLRRVLANQSEIA